MVAILINKNGNCSVSICYTLLCQSWICHKSEKKYQLYVAFNSGLYWFGQFGGHFKNGGYIGRNIFGPPPRIDQYPNNYI